jgi:DNA-binding beta-propeller fold protein YncE
VTRSTLRALSIAWTLTGLSTSAFALEVKALAHAAVATDEPAQLAVEVTGAIGDVSVSWSFGDGQSQAPTSGATTVEHAYAAAGHYTVIVNVEDSQSTRGTSFLQTVHWPLADRPPKRSSSIVHDDERKLVYVTNPDHGSIGIIDADGLAFVAEVPTFAKPTTLALAPSGMLWVAHQDDYAIGIVDPDRRQLVGAIDLPYASQPSGLVFSPTGDRAYVALRAVGKLLQLDTKTRKVTASLDVGPAPFALAVSSDGQRIFGTRFSSPADHGEVFEVSGSEFSLVQKLELVRDKGPDTDTSGRGVPNYLSAISLSPDERSAWVAAKKDNTERGLFLDGMVSTPENTVRSMIARLDLATSSEQLASRIDVDNRNLPGTVCFSPLGDHGFVSTQGNDLVVVIDAYTGSTVATIDRTGKVPLGLALSPDGKLFVQAFLSRSVSAFDVTKILSAEDYGAPSKLAEVSSVASEALADDVLLGKKIFYDSADPRMSREGYLSCASCHIEGDDDGRVWDFTSRGEGLRNTTALIGKRGVGQGRLHWTANFDEVQDFEHDIRNAFGGTGFMADVDFHSGTRDQTLGDAKAGVSPELDALAAYVTSLDHVHASPHRNPDGTLTPEAMEGKKHFLSLGCDGCHAGTDFTDSAEGVLHDVGTITEASGKRLGAELTGFDTPTLLGVWETAPYLHDGSASTLSEVFTLRNPNDEHGATSTLSDTELSELQAYLLELDSELGVRTLPVFPEEETDAAPAGGCACAIGGPEQRVGRIWLGAALAFFALRRPRTRISRRR